MRLRKIRIDRLAGIDEPFEVGGLNGGINVVLGPNASGKSSLGRALKAMWFEDAPDDVAIKVSAEVVLASGREIIIERSGRSIDAFEASRSVELPSLLPGLAQAGLGQCYVLELEDLTPASQTELSLQRRLDQLLVGGIDLHGLRGSSALSAGPLSARSQFGALQAAESELRAAEATHRGLRAQEATLHELQAAYARAEASAVNIGQLETALGFARAHLARERAEAVLREYPALVSRLRGDEIERLEAGRHRVALAKQKVDSQRRQAAQLQAEIAASAFASMPYPMGRLEQLSSLVTARGEDRDRREQCATAMRERAVSFERTCAELGMDPGQALVGVENGAALEQDDATRATITPDDVTRAEALVRRLEQANAHHDAAVAELDALGSDTEGARVAARRDERESPESTDQAIRALMDWLSAARPHVSEWLAWAGLLVAIIVVGWLSIEHGGWPGWLALAVIGFSFSIWSFRLTRALTQTKAIESAWDDDAIVPPDVWSVDAVGQRLVQLRRDSARLHALGEQRAVSQARAERLRSEQARSQAMRADIVNELELLASKVGFAPDRVGFGFDRWLRLTLEHDELSAQMARLGAERDHLAACIDASTHAIDTELDGFRRYYGDGDASNGTNTASDSLSMGAQRWPDGLDDEACVRWLHESLRAWEALTERLVQERRITEEREAERANAESENARIFEGIGLSPGQNGALSEADSRLTAYRQARADLDGASAVEAAAREQLRQYALAPNPVLAAELSSMEAELEEAVRQSAQMVELGQQIATIEERIEAQQRTRPLERARNQVDACRAALADRRDQVIAAATARFFLQRAVSEYELTARPSVLRRAEYWFAQFTEGRYQLHYEPNHGFGAIDLGRDTTVPIAELSSGTRAQLLLAVRIAFVEESEAGYETIPLIIDDALATSDEPRAAAVARALATMASGGEGEQSDRQVIYLTPQPAIPAVWRSVLGDDVNVVELENWRAVEKDALDVAHYLRADGIPMPRAPLAGEAPDAYAASLGVAPIRLDSNPLAIDCYFMLSDRLELAHQLRLLQVITLGQLRSAIANGRLERLFDDDTIRTLSALATAANDYLLLRRQGRGRHLMARDLEGSPLTEHMRGQIIDIVDQLDGDAARLIEGLDGEYKVKRLQTKVKEALHDWLREQGFIDERPRLSFAAVVQGVAARSHDATEAGTLSLEAVSNLCRVLEQGVDGDTAPPDLERMPEWIEDRSPDQFPLEAPDQSAGHSDSEGVEPLDEATGST